MEIIHQAKRRTSEITQNKGPNDQKKYTDHSITTSKERKYHMTLSTCYWIKLNNHTHTWNSKTLKFCFNDRTLSLKSYFVPSSVSWDHRKLSPLEQEVHMKLKGFVYILSI